MAKFQPGVKTAGRKKGTPNLITKTLKEMIIEALDRHGGADYLERIAEEEPVAFCTLLAKILPMQLAAEGDKPLIIVTRAE